MTWPQVREIQVNGVPVSVYHRAVGSPTLVFLHGLGCAKESFLGAFHAPELAGFSLCAFDFPGHGRSPAPAGRCSVASCSDALEAVLDGLGTDICLVGHSLGGAVGLLAVEKGRRFRQFVSVEGNLVAQDCGVVSRRIAEQSEADFRDGGCAALAADLSRPDAVTPREWARWLAACDPAAVHQIACDLVALSDGGRLLRLYKETRNQTYVYGDSDSRPDHLLPSLAATPTRGIPGSGHFPMIDNPAHFYALIAEITHPKE